MKKVVSFMLSLALIGIIGLTAGCKKKEEAPAHKAPAAEKSVSSEEHKAPEKDTHEKPATHAEEKTSEAEHH